MADTRINALATTVTTVANDDYIAVDGTTNGTQKKLASSLVTLTDTQTLTNKTLTAPVMTTPTLGVASATTVNKVTLTAPATGSTLTIAEGKTLTASNTITLTGTDTVSVNLDNVALAASAFGTDNRIVRSDGTGRGVQSTGITVDDSDNITGVASMTLSGTLDVSGATVTGVILGANGGTGVANTGSTITLGGNLTTSGAHATTLTTTGTTGVTLPTTGTLATLAGTEELDNKTLDSSVGKGTWTASGTWTLPAITLGSNATLAENVSIVLDAALSADGKYCGITEAGTAGATLAFGDLVYLAAADSRWELTDADADATAGAVQIGVCVLAAAADGDPTTILRYGKVRADAKFPALTVGAPVYVGTTAGEVQTAQPSGTDDVIRIVGYGNTADELFLNPSNDYITYM